jgi:hypothetical protein
VLSALHSHWRTETLLKGGERSATGGEPKVGDLRNGSIEGSGTERDSLSNVGEEEVSFHFAFQCDLCRGRRERSAPSQAEKN